MTNDTEIHDRASRTEAVSGVVIVDGPDGVALTLTPQAAATTSRRLARSADEAQAQCDDGSAPSGDAKANDRPA
jgi:hypothetical protein